MKKYLYLLTTLLLATTFVLPTAIAVTSDASDDVVPFSYYSQLDVNTKAVYDAINNAEAGDYVISLDLPITVTYTAATLSESEAYLEIAADEMLHNACAALRLEQPYAYWVWGGFAPYVYPLIATDGNSASMSFLTLVVFPDENYTTDPETGEYIGVQPFIDALKEAVDKFSTSSESVRDKIQDINNYLVDLVTYDPNVSTDDESRYAHDAYGALAASNHYAVCDGYSKAFLLLCEKEGIEATIAWGTALPSGENHAWNYVLLDNGKWYCIDVTWNDGSSNGYFLLGMDTFFSNHQQGVYLTHGWSAYPFDGPPISATGYDGASAGVPFEYAWLLAIGITAVIVYALYRASKGKP